MSQFALSLKSDQGLAGKSPREQASAISLAETSAVGHRKEASPRPTPRRLADRPSVRKHHPIVPGKVRDNPGLPGTAEVVQL